MPFVVLLLAIICSSASAQKKATSEYYQLTVYIYTDYIQESVMLQYFKNALIPALKRSGYKNTGVFVSRANDTSSVKKLYVYVPVDFLDDIEIIPAKLAIDKAYQDASAAFLNPPYNQPAFNRKEVIILKAFSQAPRMETPVLKSGKSERIYELRSYESATDSLFINKLHMFNEGGEIALFKRLNFNAIFYGSVIAGAKMPNLMYMTSFENMADREAHWKSFGGDPAWKTLSAMPVYQNNVSHIDITFLKSVEFSEF